MAEKSDKETKLPAVEILEAAKALLGSGVAKGAEARDADGNSVDPTHEKAATYSIHGALTRAAFDRRDSTGLDAALLLLNTDHLQDPRNTGMSNQLNDEDIAKRFDFAIERAKGGPATPPYKDAEKEKQERRSKKRKDDGSEEEPNRST